MKKTIITLSLLLLVITAFAPQQKERSYVLTVPEHLSFAVYHLLLGDAEQQLSVAQYKQFIPEIQKDVISQMTEQANKFKIDDSLAALKNKPKKDSTKNK